MKHGVGKSLSPETTPDGEINPNHPVTVSMHDQWHKLCALALFKAGVKEMVITAEDMARFTSSTDTNIVVRTGATIRLLLVNDKEALRLAREEGAI
jgi:hypothetical protein